MGTVTAQVLLTSYYPISCCFPTLLPHLVNSPSQITLNMLCVLVGKWLAPGNNHENEIEINLETAGLSPCWEETGTQVRIHYYAN